MTKSAAKSFSQYSEKQPVAIACFQMVPLIRKTAKSVGLKIMETKSVATITNIGKRMMILPSLVAANDYDQPQIVTRLNLHLRSS